MNREVNEEVLDVLEPISTSSPHRGEEVLKPALVRSQLE